MTLRVTELHRYTMPREQIARVRARQISVTEKLSTGLRINRPSDDPLGAFRSNEIITHQRKVEQFDRNLAVADNTVIHADQALGEAADTLYRVKELTIQSLTSVISQDDARSIANEIRHLREHLRALANTRSANRFLFGGYQQNTEPYDNAFAYQGDQNALLIEVGEGNLAQVTVPGGAAFGDGTPATIDIFDNLAQLEIQITAQDEVLTENELERLEGSINQLIDARSNLGGLIDRLEQARQVNGNLGSQLGTDLANTRDTDFTEAISEMQLTENALQATLASSSRLVSGSSLLDFLR